MLLLRPFNSLLTGYEGCRTFLAVSFFPVADLGPCIDSLTGEAHQNKIPSGLVCFDHIY